MVQKAYDHVICIQPIQLYCNIPLLYLFLWVTSAFIYLYGRHIKITVWMKLRFSLVDSVEYVIDFISNRKMFIRIWSCNKRKIYFNDRVSWSVYLCGYHIKYNERILMRSSRFFETWGILYVLLRLENSLSKILKHNIHNFHFKIVQCPIWQSHVRVFCHDRRPFVRHYAVWGERCY